jgi:hypothetical protein
MPYDYTWTSLRMAGFADLTEVTGAKLPYTTNSAAVPVPTPPPPAPTPDPLQARIDAFNTAYQAWLTTAPKL